MPEGSASPAIEVNRLTKTYKEVTAVDGVSFAIRQGSITGLLGGNGAGKTTTIGMLLGLILPTAGSIRVLGVDMLTSRHTVLHRMNFESPYVALPNRLTVRQNLRIFGMLYGVADVETAHRGAADDLDLGDFIDREARQDLRRAEDARGARQGADQRAGGAAPRRADRLARSRHRRLDPHAACRLRRERAAPPSCSPRTTCPRSSGCATTSS